MYFVERNGIEIIVTGPNGLEEKLHADGIGLVWRAISDEAPLKQYAVRFGDMSDEELVAYVLGVDAFPYAS